MRQPFTRDPSHRNPSRRDRPFSLSGIAPLHVQRTKKFRRDHKSTRTPLKVNARDGWLAGNGNGNAGGGQQHQRRRPTHCNLMRIEMADHLPRQWPPSRSSL